MAVNRYFRGVTGGWVPRTGQKWAKPGRGASGRPTLVRVSGVSGRVLVVDDNKVIRQLIRVNLELEGFEVVTAADGAECLDVVHQVCPDVVTLDVVMPRLDGIKTAERLRADPRTSHLPVAIISACGEHEVGGAPSGVDAFLAKPFEPSDLVRVVRQLMHRERRERPDAAGHDGGEEPAAVDGTQERDVRREDSRPQGVRCEDPRSQDVRREDLRPQGARREDHRSQDIRREDPRSQGPRPQDPRPQDSRSGGGRQQQESRVGGSRPEDVRQEGAGRARSGRGVG
ncbi:response regulator [Streptomyces sp. NPDC002394]